MKLRPYKELIAMSKEKLDEAMAPIRARQVQAKADLEMSKIEADILTKETQVQEMCIEKDVNLNALIDKLDSIALLERRKVQFDKVLKQLFPSK